SAQQISCILMIFSTPTVRITTILFSSRSGASSTTIRSASRIDRMRGRSRQARLWLALVLTLSLGGTGWAADASPRELVAALRSGKPVVLVIARGATAKPADEAYGDWA